MTQTVTADQLQPTCDVKLVECQQLVEMAKKLIHNQIKVIGEQSDIINDQTVLIIDYEVQLKEADEERTAWYRNPFIMGILGLAVGVAGGVYVSK